MEYRYVVIDVFTDAPYGGNPLAVFLNAPHLDVGQMQAIAREMNLSETTFVTSSTAPGRFGVRIFTPATELPFAGHPTVGTAVALAETGAAAGFSEIVLDQVGGPVRVALKPGRATFTLGAPPERRESPASVEAIAAALGVKPSQITAAPWQAGYADVAYLYVEMTDPAAVSAAWLTQDGFERLGLWGPGVYVFASVGRTDGHEELFARSFVPGVGVPEDPATGAAAAALAGTRIDAAHGGQCRLTINQGIDMGRPSRIETEATLVAGTVTSVSVGGRAVVVSEGRLLQLPRSLG